MKRARAGQGPTLLEGLTYRFEEHSLGLGRIRRSEYRTNDEINEWRKRDPIEIHEKRLADSGVATVAEIKVVKDRTFKEVEEAVEFARKSPFPDAKELFDDMWADKTMPVP